MNSYKPTAPVLRLWPGVIAAALLVVLFYVLPVVVPDAEMVGLFGGLILAIVIIAWWLFFSRAPWSERIGAIVLMVLAVAATYRVVHESIRGGAMGYLLFVLSIPLLTVALVGWAVIARRLSSGARRVTMIAAIFLAAGSFTLVRTDGMKSTGPELHWRWTPTAEQRLLAAEAQTPEVVPTPIAAAPTPVAAAEPTRLATAEPKPGVTAEPTRTATAEPTSPVPVWPGFRGPNRNSVIGGILIDTDWTKSPPAQLWRRPIGPGWSSFAIDGDFIYTQEQRGEDEIVACYRFSTGAPVWRHKDNVRFWESNAGAGPRGTPTLAGGRLFALGATGIINALDARTGARIWSRNAGDDTKTEVPFWGFSASPLVVDDVVIVAASGKLVGYEVTTGKPKWFGPVRRGSYSSPHLATIGGVKHVLMESGDGITSLAPATGAVLWEHAWSEGGTTIVQPAILPDGDVLIHGVTATGGVGLRRLAVSQAASGWTVTERWTSSGLKPYFNDLVIHKGHAYGFDGAILSCIDLADGKRKWKGGRYGQGQLVLLPDQDVLLVLSEEGELALVSAAPDQFRELAKAPALNAKTWNHPVVVGDVLLVRNGEEMAAYKLTKK